MVGAARRAAMASAAARGSLWNSNFVARSRSRWLGYGVGDCCSRQYVSVIISNVYPDVSASAACVRTNFIVHGLAKLKGGSVPDDGNDDGKSSRRKQIKINNEDHNYDCDASMNNCVYYATSVDVTNKDHQNPFGRGHLHPSSDHKRSAAIHIIHLPPNRSDLMEEHFFAGEKNNEQRKEESGEEKSYYDNVSNNDVDLVVFDRFFLEEAHSFRFRQAFPTAALVLDMQDMHSLRWGRQRIVEAWDKEQKRQTQLQNQQQQQQLSDWDPLGCLPQVLDYLPTLADTNDDRFVRELASIQRSDLVLVCSPRELNWLKTVYKVPEEKLCLASFFVEEGRDDNNDKNTPSPPSSLPQSPSAGDGDALVVVVPPRFVFCGGFKHAPNADAVRILIDSVWPAVRSELPEATLHIYGAFCPDSLIAHNRKSNKSHGIHVHGYEPDLAEIFGQDGGILLAPLRFGAGIKGKIVDAWTFGMPVVTTPIGSEGMTVVCESETETETEGECFGGSVASSLKEFCEKAINLAKNPADYRKAQAHGNFLLKELFSAPENWEHVRTRLLEVIDKDSLAQKREGDYTQAMLWHQSLRSTEYFSRWVELKETSVRTKRKGVSQHQRRTLR
jgi:hypothetical protein